MVEVDDDIQKMKDMKALHPNWFQAMDYKWLRDHHPSKTDMSHWNKLDDENRRVMANWSDNDFTE